MPSAWESLVQPFRRKLYGRKPPLILINGLAEQAESWWKNHRFWRRYFDVHMPNVIAFEGDAMHRRIAEGQPITVDYFASQFRDYCDRFIQRAPYHLVASSLGGKMAMEMAHKYPEIISRVVLICPSGMGDDEQLPFIEGVRRNDLRSVITSVFHKRRFLDRDLIRYYTSRFPDRRWKKGLLRTVNGTKAHTVRPILKEVQAPTLLVSGASDRIVNPREAEEAVKELPNGYHLLLQKCGHAPQIEKSWLINRLVVHFLTTPNPTSHPGFAKLLLHKPKRATT